MKREEWMLVPPENADFVNSQFFYPGLWTCLKRTCSAIDPLKGRGFSRTAIEPKKAQDMTLWTETPAEVSRGYHQSSNRQLKADSLSVNKGYEMS